ncbi:MAG TPA: response regulator, partial [Sedimentisphaerales bacterium]
MKINRTILFVEDDAVVLTTYRNLLQREGFHIESAQDGLEALKALSQATPDLVVLDLMLPKFDGADVLKFIRADPRLKIIPIIIFSNVQITD